MTPYLKLNVPGFTVLNKNPKGIYRFNDVMAAIDGTRPVRGHGDRYVPVWGEAFRK